MTTRERIELLARTCPRLFPRAELLRLVRSQLGHVDALDAWVLRDGTRTTARAPGLIYHVCAGNLAASAFTSIAHGLVLGSRNAIKLPGEREDSSTRREILDFIRGLPKPLRNLVETHEKLDDATLREADAVIAFGSDATMESIRAKLRTNQKFIAHGHAVSLLWMAEPDKLTRSHARACAIDVLTYDQLGCLSPQAIYVPRGADVEALGDKLARALEETSEVAAAVPAAGSLIRASSTTVASSSGIATELVKASATDLRKSPSPPPGRRRLPLPIPPRPLGTRARIAEARDLAFALGHRVWLPPSRHLGWTIIHDPDPTFGPSPLHGVIILREVAESRLAAALAPVAGSISTIGVVSTIAPKLRAQLIRLGTTRFCRAGQMQFPPLAWHHDGHATLAELVTWIDSEEGA